MLVDAHCHLQDRKLAGELDAVLDRARERGVTALVVVGYDLESSLRAIDIADSHEDVYAVIGFHPHDAKAVQPGDLKQLARAADCASVVGIGEMGLDFYRNLSPPDVQRRVFREQLELARDLRLPVVVHSRNADDETFEILAEYERETLPRWPKDRPLGMMHCFAGDLPLALRYIERGFVISIAGTVTYPNAHATRAVAGGIPLRWMTVETDAPYLPPQSRRGKRNEPAYLRETVEFISSLRGESVEEVARGTALTAAWLFGLGNIERPQHSPAESQTL